MNDRPDPDGPPAVQPPAGGAEQDQPAAGAPDRSGEPGRAHDRPPPAADGPIRHTRLVDPRQLIARANVRAVAEPDPELVASVRVHGVLQPPLVHLDGEDLVLVAGHRRTAAAIAAGLERIEVVVGPPMQEALRVAAQVSENTNRTGLRPAEVADAVAQLTLLGVPAGQIAKAAGLRTAQVAAARSVAAAGIKVREAIGTSPDLTLEQAAALAAWEDEPEAVAELLAAAADGPVRFAHAEARLTERKQTRLAMQAAAGGWAAKGYQVLSGADAVTLPPGAAHVRDLVAGDGSPLGSGSYYGTGQGHAHCPGRAVVLHTWAGPDRVQEVCLTPDAAGHTRAPRPGGGGPPKEARRTVVENNKLWGSATGVRRSHLKAFLVAGRFPAALVDALHRHLLTHPGHLDRDGNRGTVFSELTGFPGSGITTTEARGLIRRQADPTAPAHRVTGLLLAATADVAERSLAVTTWRDSNRGGADWLTLLVAHTGYQLADIEVVAMKATDPGWAPPAAAAAAPPAAGRAVRARTARPAAAGR